MVLPIYRLTYGNASASVAASTVSATVGSPRSNGTGRPGGRRKAHDATIRSDQIINRGPLSPRRRKGLTGLDALRRVPAFGGSRRVSAIDLDVLLNEVAAPGPRAGRAEVQVRGDKHVRAGQLGGRPVAIEPFDLPVAHQPDVADANVGAVRIDLGTA